MARFNVSEPKERALNEWMERLGIREADLDESFVRASGPGGQRRNKRSTAVRLLHRPSGIEVKCQRERSQNLNRFLARRILCARLEQQLLGSQSPAAHRAARLRKQKDRRRRRLKSRSA